MYSNNGLKLKLSGFAVFALLASLLTFALVSPVAIADGPGGGGTPPSNSDSVDTGSFSPGSSSDPSAGGITLVDLLITEMAILASQIIL